MLFTSNTMPAAETHFIWIEFLHGVVVVDILVSNLAAVRRSLVLHGSRVCFVKRTVF